MLERPIDLRQPDELAGHAHVLARGAQIPADAPRQPVRAAASALRVPSASLVELAEVREQSVHRRIEVRCMLGNALTQSYQITRHDRYVSERSDISHSITRSGDCDTSGRNEAEARARPGESYYFVVTGGGPGMIEQLKDAPASKHICCCTSSRPRSASMTTYCSFQDSATIAKFIQDHPPVARRAACAGSRGLREALRRDGAAKIEAAIPERERET